MKKTNKNIEAYKKSLPQVKGKVAAVAMLLVLSFMMVSASSFAWLVISRSPEVSGVNTTITANGNLEIALVGNGGAEPEPTAIGDGGKDILERNLTWGNLINLSDTRYGLNEMILRPATLNGSTGLLTSPLHGIEYASDGSYIKDTTEKDFSYVYYTKDEQLGGYVFKVDSGLNKYGVRAISTVQWVNLDGDNEINRMAENAGEKLNAAKSSYAGITNNQTYINSLQGLIELYAQSTIDGGLNDMVIDKDHVIALKDMLDDIERNVMELCAESYLSMVDMCEFKETGKVSGLTVSTLFSNNNNILKYKEKINSLQQFATDRKQMISYLDPDNKTSLAYWAEQAANGTTVQWKNISGIINWICNPGTCIVDGYPMSTLKSNAMSILNKSSHSAVIVDGALQRIEQRIGQYMRPKIKITVDASSISPLAGRRTLDNITITTQVDQAAVKMPIELDTVKKSSGYVKGTDGIAEDTYAYAIDFWVRTNAENSYLSLEGNVLTVTKEIDKTDDFGHKLYTARYEYDHEKTSENGETQTVRETVEMTVYEDNGKYYLLDDGTPVSDLAAENGVLENEISYIALKETVTEVVGYEGEDRVWDDSQLAGAIVSGRGATQGSGSCYVFYADNSADQDRILKLIANVKVAFIDENGVKLATAFLDAEHYYADSGKVTVPLVLSEAQGESVEINGKRFITPLIANKATRITALVYLDGASVQNSMVLSNGEVQGTMNIQFGSSRSPLYSIENEDLMNKQVWVSASASKTEFDYDPKQAAHTVLTVNVEGSDCKKVAARFVRKINNTYGSWQQEIKLTKTGGAQTWTGEVDFEYPGTYILKSVWVDDHEYSLDEPVEVTVKGDLMAPPYFVANNANRSMTVMTAENYFNTVIRVAQCSASEGKVVFVSEDGNRVTVNLKQDKGMDSLSGTANFTSSGKYTAMFYYVNGQEYELSPEDRLVAEVILGLKASAYITCDPDTLSILNLIQSGASPANFVVPDASSLRLESLVQTVLGRIIDNQMMDEHSSEKSDAIDLQDSLKNGASVSDLNKTKLSNLSKLKTNIDKSLSSEGTQTFASRSGSLTDEETTLLYNLSDDLALLGRLCDSSDENMKKAINALSDGSVPLNVSCKIMDNSGSVIKGLENAKLYYGKSGSNIKGLDCDLEWNEAKDSYEGNFSVKEAGVYSFKNITVDIAGNISTISQYTSAPSVRAMPPSDTTYEGSSTVEYQYVPNGDGEMSVELAYSSAARVEATISVNDGSGDLTESNIEGVRDLETMKDGKPVNEWSFQIPKNRSGNNEGNCTLESITLYGVYYDGVFYPEEGSGVTIDLRDENIKTKAVQNIYVTLSGENVEENGYFMDQHTVSSMSVTVEDFEQKPINISDGSIQYLKVTYDLDETQIGIGQDKNKKDYPYQYQVDGLESVVVEGSVTALSNSKTVYNLTNMQFQYAGMYNFRDIKLGIGNQELSAGPNVEKTKNIKLSYVVGGVKSENTAPTVEVKWSAPTVKITNTNPAPNSSFNLGDPDATAHNYFEDFYANVYGRKSGSLLGRNTYALPKITLQLTNAGTKISSSNKVTFTIPSHDYPDKKNVVEFTANNTSKETEVGATENSGGSRRYCGNVSISNVTIAYDGKTFTVKLSNTINIYEGNNPLGSFAYNVGAEYADIIDVSAEYNKIQADAAAKGVSVILSGSGAECNDGRQFSVTLPSATVTKIVQVPVGDSVITYRYTETTQPIKWTTTESDGCNGTKDTEHTGSKVTTVKETISTGVMATFERTYKIDKWSIETFSVATGASSGTTQANPGTVRNVQFTNRYVATPIVSYVDGDQIGDPVSGSSVTATEETVVWKEGNSTISSEPAGWTNNGSAKTDTWESDS